MYKFININYIRNSLIAVAAIILGVTIFLSFQFQINSFSLTSQAKQAISMEAALVNGKPTVIEFYASWCASCQAMASNLAKLKKEYSGIVNFVMLNVDNNKWLPDILNYRINGIPYFIFINDQGKVVAKTIGEQPLIIMRANLDALINNKVLPYSYSFGKVSDFNAVTKLSSDTPLSYDDKTSISVLK